MLVMCIKHAVVNQPKKVAQKAPAGTLWACRARCWGLLASAGNGQPNGELLGKDRQRMGFNKRHAFILQWLRTGRYQARIYLNWDGSLPNGQ